MRVIVPTIGAERRTKDAKCSQALALRCNFITASGRFAEREWSVHRIDNDTRADFLGPAGDPRWNKTWLEHPHRSLTHHAADIRDHAGVPQLVRAVKPNISAASRERRA